MDFQSAEIKLIVGLGNLGRKYINTRHNSGFLFIDQLATVWQAPNWKENSKLSSYVNKSGKIILAKPNTMMNLSGKAVSALVNYFKVKPENLILVYDDLDISLGEYKLQFARFPKMHNGVKSVTQFINSENYWHLRLGIDNREAKGNADIPGEQYALERFTTTELETMLSTIKQVITDQFTT